MQPIPTNTLTLRWLQVHADPTLLFKVAEAGDAVTLQKLLAAGPTTMTSRRDDKPP